MTFVDIFNTNKPLSDEMIKFRNKYLTMKVYPFNGSVVITLIQSRILKKISMVSSTIIFKYIFYILWRP